VIVIEASAMVDALVGEPANPELLALLADTDLHAPALLDYEVASALRIDRYPLATMMSSVLAIRENFTVYGATYIVLAQALEAPLVTADAKLAGAHKIGVEVRDIRAHP